MMSDLARRESESCSPVAHALGWTGFTMMLVLALIRAMIEHDGFPWWASDPFMFSPPVIGLTPSKAIMLNLGVMLSGCLVLWGVLLKRTSIGLIQPTLFLVGLIVVVFHAYTDVETVLPASNILAVISVLSIASLAHKFGDLQRLLGAATLSFAVLLVVMGGYEMLITHRATVMSYEQTKDSFLAARGWSAGSFETLAYERRLYQADPIVWFGLTNVFASFCGASAAGLFTLSWKSRASRRFSLLMGAAGVASFGGLVLSGAKGGLGAFLLGGILVFLALKAPKQRNIGRSILLACGLIILGIVLRGMIGEGIGERSLLFRWQYMVGSVGMFLKHWVIGVGPGNFQDAYAIYKPALSPEDVSSPHNLAMNLIATLGLGGIAWTALCARILTFINPNRDAREADNRAESPLISRRLEQMTIFVIALASVVSIRFGSPAMDSGLLLTQLVGSMLWAGVALMIIGRGTRSMIRWGMFAAASVLAIHSMIEVNASWYVSGLLVAMMVGSSCTQSVEPRGSENRSRGMIVLVLVSIVGGVGVIGVQLQTIVRWENELHLGAEPAAKIAYLRSEMDSLEFSGSPDVILESVADALSLETGHRVMPTVDSIVVQLNALELRGRVWSSEHLVRAAKIRPSHTPTSIAASSQLLWLAWDAQRMGEDERSLELWDQAVGLLEEGADLSAGGGGYRWLGTVWRERAAQAPWDPNKRLWLDHAMQAWTMAFDRSPHDPHLALKLMDLARELNEPQASVRWARIALDLHEKSRLDPLRGLEESDLMRVRTVIQSGE